MLKHLTDALVGLGGALEVLVGANLLADLLTLCNRVSHMQSGGSRTNLGGKAGGCGKERLAAAASLTSSAETGFWLVLFSSSWVLGSYRRSFLQPTRMMGRPWQKWRTSEIHYIQQLGGSSIAEMDERSNSTFSWTLSRESGESMAKQIKMT